jgi:quercetin dioxygenase-like cupin family protein
MCGHGAFVQHWNLHESPAYPPEVLHSRDGEGRVVLIALDPAQALGEHQVKEAALILVVDGGVRVDAGDETIDAHAGDLFRFDPDERRAVTSNGGARLLLVLAPWPGEGHYRGDRGEASVSASS